MPLATLRRRAESSGADRSLSIDPKDINALARVLQSEAAAPHYSTAERYAIARAVINHARHQRVSVYALLAPLGREQRGGNPPFSTARKATAADAKLARRVLLDAKRNAPDPVHGAGAFFEPSVQEILKHLGDLFRGAPDEYPQFARWEKYRKGPPEIRAAWGKRLARVGRFEFYR
jgi:hypothetical protein